MNENPNAAAELAAEEQQEFKQRASPAGQSDANAGAGPEAAGQAAQTAAEFKALFAKLEDNFDQFDVLDLEKMRDLFVVPGVRELVGDIDPKIIELLILMPQEQSTSSCSSRSRRCSTRGRASERTVAEPGNVEESPFQDMNLEDE
jgi:hypothetical protein